MSQLTGAFPLEKSCYYQHWRDEHAAIEMHKWYLSEQAGHDVGWSYAQWNWIMAGHRARWIAAGRSTGIA
jgi:hypothetical protein